MISLIHVFSLSCVLRGRVVTSSLTRGLPGVRVSQHDAPGVELAAGFTLTRMDGGYFDIALPSCAVGAKVRYNLSIT